jgi:hypothetical protein
MTLVGALAVAVVRREQWSATSADIVLPSSKLDATTSAGYYEALSRGQIVATVAEILRQRDFQATAADRLNLSPAQRRDLGVKIQAVPETALIKIAVTSPERRVAGRMADAVLAEANRYFGSGWNHELAPTPSQAASRPADGGLLSPYTVTPVSSGLGNEHRVGISTMQLGVVALLVALVAGFLAQQASQQLAQLLAARRPVRDLRQAGRPERDRDDVQDPGNGAVVGHTWTSPPSGRSPSRRT